MWRCLCGGEINMVREFRYWYTMAEDGHTEEIVYEKIIECGRLLCLRCHREFTEPLTKDINATWTDK